MKKNGYDPRPQNITVGRVQHVHRDDWYGDDFACVRCMCFLGECLQCWGDGWEDRVDKHPGWRHCEADEPRQHVQRWQLALRFHHERWSHVSGHFFPALL